MFNFNAAYNEIFSLQDLRDDDIVQTSPLLKLDDEVLTKILEYIPLKERIRQTRRVCKKFSSCVQSSVKSVAFFRDELDFYNDAKLLYFLSIYGQNVEYLNYDLYRTTGLTEIAQWSWRQSVIRTISMCSQLKHLDILICTRHRLRDADLNRIFKQCPHLETLKLDAQYIIGHCFTKSPKSLLHLEMELCYRIIKPLFIVACSKWGKLKTLHISQLYCLDEKIIKKLVSSLKNLEQLSIVADPERTSTPIQLADLCRLFNLHTLCLEGFYPVTDRFIGELCNVTTSPVASHLEHLSLAYCRNIGVAGIQHLAKLPRLVSLNLDGLTRRDVSQGVASIRGLQRLLVSDDTFVSNEAIIELTRNCANLKILDISNNRFLANMDFAEQLTSVTGRANRLVVLTDNEPMWMRCNPREVHQNNIEIVHIHRQMIPINYYSPISQNAPHQLASGLLMPELRRGNRCRMLEKEMSSSDAKIEPVQIDEQDTKTWSEMMLDPMLINNFGNLGMMDLTMLMNPVFMTGPPDVSVPPPMIPPVTASDPMFTLLTLGSAGAPRPPSETQENKNVSPPPVVKYSRPARSSRKSGGVIAAKPAKVLQVRKDPQFTDDDFPPLG